MSADVLANKCEVAKASCSGEETDNGLSFQYEWIVKICRRSIGSEAVILNVSPAFSTAFNGVQFTWTLRLSDDFMAPAGADGHESGVNVFLYYKEGPAQDINILDASMNIADSEGKSVFSDIRISECEFTRGSGWASRLSQEDMHRLTDFMQDNTNNAVRITIDIRMDANMFSPLCYLPCVDLKSSRLESECKSYLKEVEVGAVVVPDLDLVIDSPEMFAVHRRVFTHGCEEVGRRMDDLYDGKQVLNVFAHVYFTECIMPGVDCVEEFIEVIEGGRTHHIPALVRQAERFMCRELIASSDEVNFAKKMLLLAQHYQLPVLKMMCTGILADRIVEQSSKCEHIDALGDEMRQLVRQITFTDDVCCCDEADNDSLVESVVEEVKMLSRRIRRVSVSRSCSTTSEPSTRSNSVSSSPVAPNGSS